MIISRQKCPECDSVADRQSEYQTAYEYAEVYFCGDCATEYEVIFGAPYKQVV